MVWLASMGGTNGYKTLREGHVEKYQSENGSESCVEMR